MGRPFSLIDNAGPRAVCLVNEKTRDTLGLDADPIGQTLMVDDRRFTIVGVVAASSESSLFNDGRSGLEVFIPFKLAWSPKNGVVCDVASRSPDVSSEAQAEVHAFMRHKAPSRHYQIGQLRSVRHPALHQRLPEHGHCRHRGWRLESWGSRFWSRDGDHEHHCWSASRSGRARSALRKAVGARPSAIMLQFLIEAMVLCLLGGIVGVLAGEGITLLFRSFPAARLWSGGDSRLGHRLVVRLRRRGRPAVRHVSRDQSRQARSD